MNAYLPGYPKFFLDMDNCLTDFTGAVQALGHEDGLPLSASEEAKKAMYKAIEDAGEGFWSTMNWAEGGQELYEFLKPWKPVLLSSPGEFLYAEAGKTQWVKDHIPGTTLLLEPDKYRYAERDAILIDDMISNIEGWQKQGGIGILHKDTNTTIEKVKALLPSGKVSLASVIRRIVGDFR